eukprot:scaffold232423_cov29-Tisochrysis_lutea.AAC.1
MWGVWMILTLCTTWAWFEVWAGAGAGLSVYGYVSASAGCLRLLGVLQGGNADKAKAGVRKGVE